ncbi:hypothetical protein DFH28DRAFT_1081636 [Melampsora americana]|nr:hypothetical protein DFH28DRAFT_1081636 [Melampsora americana]
MSIRFNSTEEVKQMLEGVNEKITKDQPRMIYHHFSTHSNHDRLPTSISPSLSFSPPSSTPQLISSLSSSTTHPSSPQTPKRMVHFLEDPSPIDDDALDLNILTILSSEDRFGILSILSRLLERPLRFSNKNRRLSNSHSRSRFSSDDQNSRMFEIELNRRLRKLNHSSFPREKRWSSDLGFEESLLEFISDRLELKDSILPSHSKFISSSSSKELHPSTSIQVKNDDEEEDLNEQVHLQRSWFISFGSWVLDNLSSVPWYSISSV